MRLRTIALALALACGFTAAGEAKKDVVRPAARSHRVKRVKRSAKGRHAKKAYRAAAKHH